MNTFEKIPDIFASHIFSEDVMRERLPKDVYKSLISTIANGKEIDAGIADVVAGAMKDWAIALGATHFTHWFQPLTGVTAEKHDAFLSPVGHGMGHRKGCYPFYPLVPAPYRYYGRKA